MYNISFPACSFILSFALLVMFYSRKRIDTIDTKIFGLMLISSFFDSLIVLIIIVLGNINFNHNSFVYVVLNKVDFIHYFVWPLLLFLYVFNVSFNDKKLLKNVSILLSIINFLAMLIMLFLPLEVVISGTKMGVVGIAPNFIMAYNLFYVAAIMFIILKNCKKSFKKEYVPFFVLLLCMFLVIFLRLCDPYLVIIPFAFTFVDFIMMYTIANPDMQMLEELLKNRKLASSSFEDKSTFLFNMSQRIKEPVYRISDSVKEYQNTTKKEIKESAIESIEQESRKLTFTVNDLLNVNSLDANKIKITKNYYNTYNFFEDIKKKAEYAIAKKSNVDFYFEIAKTLPDEFYGDSVKLKQVIMSVINNSIKFTDSGSVQVFVDAISRYDASRLFISIKDTGCGMSLEKVNELLSLKESETEEDTDVDKLDVKLKSAIKIIRLLGGNINIKSTENVGTELIIVLDQRIRLDSKNDKKKDNILNTYSNQLLADKMILLVDDDSDELNKLSGFFESKGYHTSICMYGKECIDRIKAGEKYKFILMKDEMNPDNALPVLNELKTLSKFKTPVIIMLNENKMFLKEHYIKDGFDDCLLLDDFTNELNRIIDKYFK